MKKFKCWYGLNGSFGGARDYEIEEFENEDRAIEYAYNLSCEEYSKYEGSNSMRTFGQIIEEENLNDDDLEDIRKAQHIYEEERGEWLEYRIELIEEEN